MVIEVRKHLIGSVHVRELLISRMRTLVKVVSIVKSYGARLLSECVSTRLEVFIERICYDPYASIDGLSSFVRYGILF